MILQNMIKTVDTMFNVLIFISLTKTESSESIQNTNQGKAIETIKAKQSGKKRL